MHGAQVSNLRGSVERKVSNLRVASVVALLACAVVVRRDVIVRKLTGTRSCPLTPG